MDKKLTTPQAGFDYDPALENIVKGVSKLADTKAWKAETGDSFYKSAVQVGDIWIRRGYGKRV